MEGDGEHNERASLGAEIGETLLMLSFLPLYLIGWTVQGLWWLFVKRGH